MPDPVTPVTETVSTVGEGDLEAFAAETVRDSEAAVVRPEAAAAAPSGPVDRWGRPFDPALHKIRPDGTPQLRGGNTLILKSRAARPLTAPLPRSQRATAGGDFLDTGAAGVDIEMGGLKDEALHRATELPQEVVDVPVTPEEARMDGQAIADAFEMLGQVANPDEGAMKDPERQAIETRWSNVMLRYQLRLPIGQILLATLATAKYGGRVVMLPKTQERVPFLRRAVDWVLGRDSRYTYAAPAKQGGDQAQPANQLDKTPRQAAEPTGLE